MKKISASALVGLMVLASFSTAAFAEDETIFDISSSPMAPVTERTAIVVLPGAYNAAMAKAKRVGESTVVSIDLLVGMGMTGARVEGQVWTGNGVAVQLEALGGYGFTTAGWFPMAGGGARVQFTVAEDARHKNALFISPGLDMYLLTGSATGGGFLGLVPYTNVYFIGTNVDIQYVHQFASHFSWDIGLRLGADVALSGKASNGRSAAGRPSPELGLFTGVRF